MLFEFVCGFLPFADDLDDPTEVCAAVLGNRLQFPKGYRDSDGKDLMLALLCRQREKRLGAGPNGIADVKAAAFYRNGQEAPQAIFDKIMGRELEPPLAPDGETYCDDEEAVAADNSDEEELFGNGKAKASATKAASGKKAKGQSNDDGSAPESRKQPAAWASCMAGCCSPRT